MSPREGLELGIIFCGVAIALISPQVSQAQSVEQEIQKTGVLNMPQELIPEQRLTCLQIRYCAIAV
ncbi:MAG: hypothetical protein AAGA80_03725 [Cyanobacteria bacterium P01_F01_bin.143]